MLKEGKWSLIDTLLRWIIPLAISGLAIWFLLSSVDYISLVEAFRTIRIDILIWSSLISFCALLFRVWCWYLLLQKQFSYKRVFFVMNAGYLFNNVFPFRLGEVGRAIILGGGGGSGPGILEVFSSIVVERVYDVALAAAFFLGTLSLVLVEESTRFFVLILLGMVLVTLLVLILLSRNRQKINRWLLSQRDRRYWLANWAAPKLDAILKGFAVLTNPLLFFESFGLLVISWLLAFLQQFIILRALIPDAPFWWVVFILGAGALGMALPSAPAGLGVFEASVVGAFLLLNVDYATALAYALIVHSMQFTYSSILGVIGLITEGQSVSGLYRRAKMQKQDEKQVL